MITPYTCQPGSGRDAIGELLPAEEYPHLVEMITEQVVGKAHAYGDEFEFGLQLVLDGLEHRLGGDAVGDELS